VIDLPTEDLSAEATSVAAVLLLAVIQGTAEFLPISSSGHLVLARGLLGVEQAGLTLDVALHVGTLAAVLWAYRRNVGELIGDVLRGRWRMALWLVLATLPVGVVGMALKPRLESAAESSQVAGTGLLITGLILFVGDRARKRRDEPEEEDQGGYGTPLWSHALLLGLAQTLAICPGISRSGTTIAAGLLLGLPIVQAARLSFLMSIPAVAGAALVELPDVIETGIGDLSSGLVLGAVALSGFVGWAALRTLLVVMSRGAFLWFAGYCALLGTLTLALL
jgi:undecaprenyl-diphosphatase